MSRRWIVIAVAVSVVVAGGAFLTGWAVADPTTSAEYEELAEESETNQAAVARTEKELERVQGDLSRAEELLAEARAQVEALTSEPRDSGGIAGEPAVSGGAAVAPRNIKIGIRIRRKACFGSAGCSLDVQIDPSYVGEQDVSSGAWDITYEIRGGEDGPVIETMTLEDGTFTFPSEQSISTASSGAQLDAVVTAVHPMR